MQAVIYVLLVGIIAGLVGWINQSNIKTQWCWYTVTRPYMIAQFQPHVLAAEAERALKPKDSFKECANDCPEMVVIPAGSFMMGSSANDAGHDSIEEPQHKATIARPFAVSKFLVTFADWDACAAFGDCAQHISDGGFGRDRRPAISVTWYDAQRYVAWLSKMTGKTYRLLSEAEYEYAARGGTQTTYPWGNKIGKANANCDGCGSRWDSEQTAPVGSFAPNRFGLYDMIGNVTGYVEDCYHGDYNGAPQDGSAWVAEGGSCKRRVTRGGSWGDNAEQSRSASRDWAAPDGADNGTGFRIGRALTP